MLALGYRLDPQATEAAFAGGWFATRDAGALDADGRLTVHGRLDDVVISGGVNVAPQTVEAVLREHPDVADAVVFGRPDDEWGQRVVAAVVPAPGAAPVLPALRDWVTERLGAPSAPRELHVVATVPLLHTGKPDRRAVAGRGARLMATPAQWVAGARPRTLPAALAPVLVGTGAAAALGGFRPLPALLALVVALALQVAVNYANDYSDGTRGTDADRVGPMRLVGSGAAAPAAGADRRRRWPSPSPPSRAWPRRAVELVAGRRRRGLHRGRLDLHRRPAPLRLPGAGRGVRLRLLRPGRGRRHDLRADRHAARAGVRRRRCRSAC